MCKKNILINDDNLYKPTQQIIFLSLYTYRLWFLPIRLWSVCSDNGDIYYESRAEVSKWLRRRNGTPCVVWRPSAAPTLVWGSLYRQKKLGGSADGTSGSPPSDPMLMRNPSLPTNEPRLRSPHVVGRSFSNRTPARPRAFRCIL